MTAAPHLHWGAEALWETLEPLLPGLSVEVLARVESTNTRLLERAREFGGDPETPVTRPGELDALSRAERTPHGRRHGDVSPCLLVAEQQTRGRGRMGRDWISHAGASLTFSLSLPLEPVQWGGLSLAVGLALAEALDPAPGGAAPGARTNGSVHIGLKWPNDLWLIDPQSGAGQTGRENVGSQRAPNLGRKLGGILIETVSVGQRRLCVVGVGLNVLPAPAGSSEGLAHGYGCLQELDPQASAPRALQQLARPLVQALKRFESEGFAPLQAAYQRRDLLRGHEVLTTGAPPLQGVAEGVDATGALQLRTGAAGHADGAPLQRVLSGEVSVRLASGRH